MSFDTELLDCFDLLKKRSAASLDATHVFGSFVKNLSLTQKECHTKMMDLIGKTRKEYIPKCDYTVQQAFTALADELEIIYSAQASFIDAISDQRKEIEAHLKEKEKRHKALIKEGETLEKGWEVQLDTLKKSRVNYVKLGKEAQSMAENLEKKKLDSKTKPEVVSQLSSKTMAAAEKRDQADQLYKQTLEATNSKMEIYYSSEQPALIAGYKSFEEDRITYMKDHMDRFLKNVRSTNLSSVFTTSCDKMGSSINAIDMDRDIDNWANDNGKRVCIPEPIPYLTYDIDGGFVPEVVTGSGRKPGGGSGSSGSTRRPPAAIPTEANSGSSASLNTGSKHGKSKSSKSKSKSKAKSSFVFDASKYNISDSDRQNPEKTKAAAKKLLKLVNDDMEKANKDLAAAEKLCEMYASDPSARAEVEGEVSELKSVVEQLSFIKNDLTDAMNAGGAAPTVVSEAAGELFTATYSYDAANDTELSFTEGSKLTILQKDDSGWWFASLNGREGFVPANYMSK